MLLDPDKITASARDLIATFVRHDAGSAISLHTHPFGQLSVVTSGTMILSDENGWWLAPPGRAAWVPPGICHGARYAESSAQIKMLLSPELSQSFPRTCATLSVSGLLRELALEAIDLSLVAETEKTVLVNKLIVHEAVKPSHDTALFVPQGRDPRLVRVIEYLRSNPASDSTFDELAMIAACSARTLARLFLSETGMTFGRWREHLRIVCAVDCLVRGQSVTQTAIDLGYNSPSSFTTMFTRTLGVPPARYVKEARDVRAW